MSCKVRVYGKVIGEVNQSKRIDYKNIVVEVFVTDKKMLPPNPRIRHSVNEKGQEYIDFSTGNDKDNNNVDSLIAFCENDLKDEVQSIDSLMHLRDSLKSILKNKK